jgi:polyhydroxybutyrate depolymerase
MRTCCLALACALVVSPAARAEVSKLKTGDGREREYLVHLPAGWDAKKPAPVVLVFHGGGGNAENAERTLHMDRAADAHGFIAVYPQGTGRSIAGRTLGTWNGDFCCGTAASDGVDDVAFVAALLDRLAADYAVDARRVYATGISNGALMAFKSACRLSERLAAIAAVSSPGIPTGCAPTRAVPTLFIHGTADPCTLFAGGASCGGCFSRAMKEAFGVTLKNDQFPCDGAVKQLDFASRAALCSAKEETFFQKGAATCVRRLGCAKDGEAALCRLEGAGHTWPGGEGCEKQTRLCKAMRDATGAVNQDLDASEAIWAFFARHALPPK